MSTPPTVIWEYFDCGDSVGRYGTDGPPSALPPIPSGCFEITEEQYLIRQEEIRGEVEALKASLRAADRQAEDDRISDIVAVKVAEVLAAQTEPS